MPAAASLTERVTPLTTGAEVVACAMLGQEPVFALADGSVLFAQSDKRVVAHPEAAMLVARATRDALISGGDDGRLVETRSDGTTQVLAHEKGGWIDSLSLRGDGAIAWSVGKTARVRDAKGEVKSLAAPSSVRGLCFMPKGYRVALAHYNGVSLWFPNVAGEPEGLAWRGSHLDVTAAPDGRFLVTTMQESALHGWRLADAKDMRMTGYPSKTRSLSWSHDGKWLATSGAAAAIVWPFDSKEGPMGKGPRECLVRETRVTRVAFHPKTFVLAAGFEDGWLLLCRLTDNAEILVRQGAGGKGVGVSALAWDADGRRLLFGCEDGAAGVVELER